MDLRGLRWVVELVESLLDACMLGFGADRAGAVAGTEGWAEGSEVCVVAGSVEDDSDSLRRAELNTFG